MSKRAIDAAAPKAIGPYSPAVEANGILYVSGQIHMDPATGALTQGDIRAHTRQCLENLNRVLEAAGYAFGDLIKTTVFLADMMDFPAMNEIYASYMKAPFPARSTVQVAALPLGARVEIEAIAQKHDFD